MAFLSEIETPAVTSRLNRSLSNFWTGLIEARKASFGYSRRAAQMERLCAKSDEELAEMGLQRSDIAQYVFRDLISL